MMLVALFKMAASLPMPIDKLDILQEIGTKVYVSSKEELKKFENGTIPQAFLSDLTPSEYYKQHGYNTNDDLDMVKAVMQSSLSSARRSKRSPGSCPITWKVNKNALRMPESLFLGECNSSRGTCLGSNGRPACSAFKMVRRVWWYRGFQPETNKHVYQIELINVTVACSCSG